MGSFSQLNDDDAELLTGGVVNPSKAYDGSNFGGYKKFSTTNTANPANFYGGTNHGTAKRFK